MREVRDMVSGESVWEKESQSKCPKIAAAVICLRNSRKLEWLEQSFSKGNIVRSDQIM